MAYIYLIKCIASNSESDGLMDFFEVYIVENFFTLVSFAKMLEADDGFVVRHYFFPI